MSLNELQVIAGFLERAVCPEDIFGNLAGSKAEQEKALKLSYRRLAKAVHPDAHNGDSQARKLAEQLFKDLEVFHQEAERRIKKGSYGSKEPLAEKVPTIIKGKFVKERFLVAGDIADLFVSSVESSSSRGGLILKVARTADDNDLLRAEAEALGKMQGRLSKMWKACVPEILDSFLLDEGKSARRRQVNVLRRFSGFLDCETIRGRLPQGVDGRTIAWMWKRLLIMLEWTSKIGLVHGAVLPPHVMFYPDNDGGGFPDERKHAVRLVDWCYAVEPKYRTRLSAWMPSWEAYYAPEVLAKKSLGPWTDLYMGAATMLYLSGAEPDKGSWQWGGGCPLPGLLADSLEECTQKNPAKRPQSVGKYFEDFTALLKKLYGAPKYHEFVVPA